MAEMTDEELRDAVLRKRLERARARKASAPQDQSFLQDMASAGKMLGSHMSEDLKDFGTGVMRGNTVSRAMDQIASYPGAFVETVGTDKPFEEARQRSLAALRQPLTEAAERSPIATGLGGATGDMIGIPSGAGIIANTVVDAGTAGVSSLADGRGMEQAAWDAAKAGSISGLTRGASELGSMALNKVSPFFEDLANKSAINAVGGTPTQQAAMRETMDQTGPLIREKGVVTFGASPTQINKNLDAVTQPMGQELGAARAMASAQPVEVGPLVANKWEQKVGMEGMSGTEKAAYDTYMNQFKGLPENISVDRAQNNLMDLRSSFQGNTDGLVKKAQQDAYRDLRGAQTEAVGKALSPEEFAKYQQNLSEYSLLKPVDKASSNAAAREASRETIGMKDILIAGGVGSAGLGASAFTDDPVKIGGTMLVSAVLRNRAPAAVASLANNLANVVKTTPHLLGKYGPQLQSALARGENALNSTSYLLQKQDPEYRKLLNGETNEDSSMP